MVVYVNLIYNINLQILQEVGIFLGGCLTVKNWWGFFRGDDGVSLPFVLLEQLLDHKISYV